MKIMENKIQELADKVSHEGKGQGTGAKEGQRRDALPTACLPSLFRGFRNAKSCTPVTWQQVYDYLTGGTLQDQTERHRYFRSQGLENDAQRIKQNMPAITPAVQCEGGRRSEQLKGLTGVSIVDFDHVPDLAATLALLRADEHTFLLHTTISGSGIRVLYRYALADGEEPGGVRGVSGLKDDALYREAFRQGNAYFARLTGLQTDPACKDRARLSVLCHDSQALFNPEAKPICLTVAGDGQQAAKSKSSADPIKKMKAAIARQGITYTPGSRNAYICRAGYLLNRYGVEEQKAVAWAEKEFADYDGDVSGIIRSCYGRKEEHGKEAAAKDKRQATGEERKGKSIRLATPQELAEYLNRQARFRHNKISDKTEIAMTDSFTDLTDRHLSTLWRRFDVEGLRTTEEHLHSVIRSDFTPIYNPFEEYFNALPPWDGETDYIALLAGYVQVNTDPDHFTHCLRKWLVGLVAGLFDEKVTNQTVLVLIGPQGCGKTTFFEYILPPPLYRYYCTKTNSNRLDKDDRLMLSEYALINFEELESMRTPEMNQLKAMITMRTVNDRRAYGRYKEQRPRVASFCGTGNNPRFLNDPTGTRRWLPFEVSHIDDPRERPFPYEGIYSQALHLLRTGFRYWFTRDEIARQAAHNSDFEVPNPEEELIQTYYRRPLPGEACKFVTTTNVQERINASIKQPLSLHKIAGAMKKIGFNPVRTASARGFLVVEYTPEELRNNQRRICPTDENEEEQRDNEEDNPSFPFED